MPIFEPTIVSKFPAEASYPVAAVYHSAVISPDSCMQALCLQDRGYELRTCRLSLPEMPESSARMAMFEEAAIC